MKIMIEIPDKDIPERQDIISVDLCFVGGKVGQCAYPFEILTQEPIEVLQEIRHEIETAQTYKIASGSHDLYIDRYNALEIIDSHIDQYKEDAG